MSERQEEIESIQRECSAEGYILSLDEAGEVRADVLEKGWSKIRWDSMDCWWDVMITASELLRRKQATS
jgi:hypothetical protein